MIDDFDFVMGVKSMYELEADQRFSRLRFELAQRSTNLVPLQDNVVKSNEEMQLKFKMVRSPPFIMDQ